MNGIKVLEHIKRDEKVTYVFFLTGYTNYIMDSFSKKTLGYIVKPIKYSKLEQSLDKVLNELNGSTPLEFSVEDKSIVIQSRSLQYIEAKGYYSRLITMQEDYLVRSTLKEWEEKLEKYDFFRIHKSYLVNISYIKQINNSVILDNDDQLPVSRRKLAKLNEAYMKYARRRAI